MKKVFKNIITKNGKRIMQITCPSERFYGQEIKNPTTGLPEIKWFASVTWIKSYYYMSPYLMKWIAEKGLSESERIRDEAGKRGDKVHQATEDIDKGIKIKLDAGYLNKSTGEMEELGVEEIEAIKSYTDYVDEFKPELLANEMTIFSKPKNEEEYAAKATVLASKPETLNKIRFQLRQRMMASDMCNPKRQARNMENAYREMWRKWCWQKQCETTV